MTVLERWIGRMQVGEEAVHWGRCASMWNASVPPPFLTFLVWDRRTVDKNVCSCGLCSICLVSAVLLERQYLLILTLRFNAQYVSGILTTCMDMHGATLVYIFCFLFASCTIRNLSNLAKDQTISSGHHACSKARSSTTGQKRIMRQHKNQTISSGHHACSKARSSKGHGAH